MRLRPGVYTATALMASLIGSFAPGFAAAQQTDGGDKVDLATLTQIKAQAFQHSQVMDHLFYLSEVYGPRVNNSANYRAAAEWTMGRLRSYGLQNVHLEPWGPFGDGWQIKHFYGALTTPAYQALIGFPLAWTPGTNGPVKGEAILAPLHTEADFAKYKGKLRGKIVLVADPKIVLMHTEPEAHRLTDEEIADRGVVPDPSRLGGFPGGRAPRNAPPPPRRFRWTATPRYDSATRPISFSRTRARWSS